MKARVFVTLKNGVLDPQGKAIGHALNGLGFGSVVLTWMYRSAQRSILIVALWHSAFNLATATRASAGVAAAVASTAVMIGGVVVAIRRHARDRPAISS